MKYIKKLSILLITSILTFTSLSLSCFAEEWNEIDWESRKNEATVYSVDDFYANYTESNDMIDISSDGVPIQLYYYVTPKYKGEFFNKHRYTYAYVTNDGKLKEISNEFFGIDAKEVAELEKGTVYLITIRFPEVEMWVPYQYIESGYFYTNDTLTDLYYIELIDEYRAAFTLDKTKNKSYLWFDGYASPEDLDEYKTFIQEQIDVVNGVIKVIPDTSSSEDVSENIPDPSLQEVIVNYIQTETENISSQPTESSVSSNEVILSKTEDISQNNITDDTTTKTIDIKTFIIGGSAFLILIIIVIVISTKKKDYKRN